MSDIFISYAREDLERTRQLANVLGSLDWKVFIDRRIPAGKTWADYIGKELEEAKCVIVIWSKASLGSRFVKLEANNALAKGKLVPVLIEDVSPPFEFSDLHAADLSRWDGDKNSEEFRDLVTDIESLIGIRPKGEAVSDKSKVEEEKRLNEAEEARRKVEEEKRLKEEAETRRKAEEEKKLKDEAETRRKAEEEKRLKEKAEARRKVEEENRLKEEAETRRKVEEENRLKEIAEAKRKSEEEKRKLKEQTEKAKIDKEVVTGLEKTTLASILKKARYKIALIAAGIIAVTMIVILVVNSGKDGNEKSGIKEQQSENRNDNSAEMQVWKDVLIENTVTGFKSYQNRYPNGIYFNEAQKKIDEIEDNQDWETALLANTFVAYQEYVRKHPTGSHLVDARQKITDLEKVASNEKSRRNEDNAWNTAKTTNTKASYQKYQKAYPNGRYYSEAVKRIKAINDATKLIIGQEYQGGIIFYIDASGQHGLIAAQSDQSTEIIWSKEWKTITGVTGKEIGSGRRNTDIIVAKLGAGNYAAKLCYDLVRKGYSDWFLPSKDELIQLYLNKDKVGGFAGEYYWSSTQIKTNADPVIFIQSFIDGSPSMAAGYGTYYVRAVRKF
jgi:hypothetical protein